MGRIWLAYWPYQERLPRHPEPEEEKPEPGRIPGLIDEAN